MIIVYVKISDNSPKEVVRFIRENAGVTQKEFANSLNLSKKTIEGYEYGTINYSFEMFMKICNKYGMEVIVQSKNYETRR